MITSRAVGSLRSDANRTNQLYGGLGRAGVYDAGMRRDGFLPADLAEAAETARRLEQDGFAGAFTAETAHDPFLPLALAADATETIELGTAIAVAFARNPMTLAYTARDLNEFSQGRLILGLGSQIKPHITWRFSMPWSAPAARMREFIEALFAIWEAWDTGGPLAFRGQHYRHVLMTDFFDPGPAAHGRPRVYLAAVGPRMTRVVADLCDGWMAHPFTTPEYFAEVAHPRFADAVADAGRRIDDIQVSLPAFVVAADDEAERARRSREIKSQIGFYGSTPAYVDVLAHHGWEDAHAELNALTKQGRWDELADVIDDTMLATFAAVADPESVDAALDERYGGLVDRISRYDVGLTG